uniref:Uncharacterized protein n=1 Tax=Kalanchoe fedtschenkoi TaxID=63787 RepID=A0A7N0RAL2_KALFE
MGELGSIWLYQEDEADDLKQKLQSTRLELDAVRLEVNAAKEQTREKEEQLNSLLQMVCKERDEAREQLHNLLHQINPTPKLSAAQPHLVMIPNPNNKIISSDESDLFGKHQLNPIANSSITESNTSSDPCHNNLNSNSYISSSSVDSIFDAVTSPEFSTLNNMGESGSNVGFVSQQTFMGQTQTHSMLPDNAMVVIDGLVKGKALPQKGKLLEAVMEAGPLLQTLMLAGPMPRWRNPPPLQPFSTPQAAAIITGTSDYSYVAPMTPSWSTGTPFSQMSCGSSSHMKVNSMLNFSNGGGNGNSGRLVSPSLGMGALGQVYNQFAFGKRQRQM